MRIDAYTKMKGMREYEYKDIKQHNQPNDCWIIIGDGVYDVTKFAGLHPGGEKILLEYGGLDCTEDFFGLHRMEVLEKYGPKLRVGSVKGIHPNHSNVSLISNIPFAETDFSYSPYYNESHLRFRNELRVFLKENVAQIAEECEQTDTPPSKEMYLKLGSAGIFAASIGPGRLKKYVDLSYVKLLADIKPAEFDYFHEAIMHQEFSRLLCPGFEDGLFGGRNISLPPLIYFGTDSMKTSIVPEIIAGRKHSALAITEPFAGSDVANIRCTAKLSECGKFYVVNGVKKWITEGHGADYFVTAVRTGGPGAGGLSMLLIENGDGVSTKLLKSVYATSAKTAYVVFEDTKVPVSNMMALKGFKAIMQNFNHERWMISVKMLSRARKVTEECFQWALQRSVFNKPLIDQPVIQEKLAKMVSRIQAANSWLDSITHKLNSMGFEDQQKLGGVIALIKYEVAQVSHVVCEEAVQIFGGRAMSKAGMGRFVERFQRTEKLPGVYGGSSEILASLGIRQALRNIQGPLTKL